jgi:hypothetical protein
MTGGMIIVGSVPPELRGLRKMARQDYARQFFSSLSHSGRMLS